jgi:two-component system nitrogen regulation sensor histidine kinase NtrY
MDYRTRVIPIIIRILIILGVLMTIPLAGRITETRQLVFTYLVIGIILAGLVIELVFHLNRTNREIVRFMEQIKNREFNTRFNEGGRNRLRRKLYGDFNNVLEVYQNIRFEKEVQFRFLEHIVELIETGIIVFDARDRVVLSNTAASDLTGVPVLTSWKQISEKNGDMADTIGTLDQSTRVLYEPKKSPSSPKLLILVSRTRMLDESYTLMSIQNVQGVVEQKETGAWNRLLHTLNHEIKNSITPIGSLADTIMLILKREDGQLRSPGELTVQHLEDLETAAGTLQERSKSLYDFVDKYHQLTRMPAPDPEIISCDTLLRGIEALFRPDCETSDFNLVVELNEEDLKIRADMGMMEQAIINLVNNSKDSLEDRPNARIVLSASRSGREIMISVSDNGTGIERDILEEVFTPFFSTRKNGSGIGLPLVRQIVRLHGGSVHIESIQEEGTTVKIILPGEEKR